MNGVVGANRARQGRLSSGPSMVRDGRTRGATGPLRHRVTAPRVGQGTGPLGRKSGSAGRRAVGKPGLGRLLMRSPRARALSRAKASSGPMVSLRALGATADSKMLAGILPWLESQGAGQLASLVRSHLDSVQRIGTGASGLIIG